MHIEKLSLYIITLNEERRLGTVLESAKDIVDGIVIVTPEAPTGRRKLPGPMGQGFFFINGSLWDIRLNGPRSSALTDGCCVLMRMRF